VDDISRATAWGGPGGMPGGSNSGAHQGPSGRHTHSHDGGRFYSMSRGAVLEAQAGDGRRPRDVTGADLDGWGMGGEEHEEEEEQEEEAAATLAMLAR